MTKENATSQTPQSGPDGLVETGEEGAYERAERQAWLYSVKGSIPAA